MKRTIAIGVLITAMLAACSGPTLTEADQRACQTANSVFTGPAYTNGDEVLTTAGFQATPGSVIQKAINHALYDLRASDFADLGDDLGYVRALCHQ